MENHFQVVILGTGLVESIAAAALAKAGYSVAHLDPSPYYGAGQASLTVDELVEWADKHKNSPIYSHITCSQALPPQSRQYSLSLAPAFIPSLGPLIGSLVDSGVARYGGYKLLESTAVYDKDGNVRIVPGSKEDVFKSKDMSLVDKRRLMRFLMFAAGDFEESAELSEHGDTSFVTFLREKYSLPDQVAEAVAYALAFRTSPHDLTRDALPYIRTVLRSSGRYGPSPFIVGHYGGCGEIAQGYCRTAAVHGAIYILGRTIKGIRPHASADGAPHLGSFAVEVDDLPDQLTCDMVLSAADLLPASLSSEAKSAPTSVPAPDTIIARGVVILDHPIYFGAPSALSSNESAAEVEGETGEPPDSDSREPVDTGMLVFPPSSVPGGSSVVAVTALISGEGSMSTPAGKWVVYLAMSISEDTSESADALLRPYLLALLRLSATPPSQDPQPAFSMTYIEKVSSSTHPFAPYHDSSLAPPKVLITRETAATVLVSPSVSPLVSEISDAASLAGAKLFWAAIMSLRAREVKPGAKGSVPEGEEASDEDVWPTTLWPPLESQGDDDSL